MIQKNKIILQKKMLERLWADTYQEILPVLNDAYKLTKHVLKPKHWPIRRALET